MLRLNIHEVKSGLSKYIERVEKGETVVVCRRNVPVAEIRPIQKKDRRNPVLGSGKGMGSIPQEFWEPMTTQEIADWEDISPADPLNKFARGKKARRKTGAT